MKALALLLLLPSLAFAGTATLVWTATMNNQDGSAVSVSEITGYKASYGLCPDGITFPTTGVLSVTVGPTTLTTTLPSLQDSPPVGPATIYCFRVYAESTSNGESAPTNVITKAMPAPSPPNPPGGLAVTAVTAYQSVRGPAPLNQLAVNGIGTVSLTTPCDHSYGLIVAGIAYYEVPASTVT